MDTPTVWIGVGVDVGGSPNMNVCGAGVEVGGSLIIVGGSVAVWVCRVTS